MSSLHSLKKKISISNLFTRSFLTPDYTYPKCYSHFELLCLALICSLCRSPVAGTFRIQSKFNHWWPHSPIRCMPSHVPSTEVTVINSVISRFWLLQLIFIIASTMGLFQGCCTFFARNTLFLLFSNPKVFNVSDKYEEWALPFPSLPLLLLIQLQMHFFCLAPAQSAISLLGFFTKSTFFLKSSSFWKISPHVSSLTGMIQTF